MRSLEEIVQLLRAPHGAGKPAQVDAAEMLEAQAREIAELKEELATVEWLHEQATNWSPDNEG
jgi:hypothetical protein